MPRDYSNTKNNHWKVWETRKRKGIKNKAGYILKQEYRERMYEHRKIIEQFISRKLNRNEIVHHKDGNKENNSIENLQIMTSTEHKRLHALESGFGKLGIGKSPTNKTSKNKIKKIIETRKTGKTILQTSKIIGLSYPTVWKYCKENNLSIINLK